MRGWLTIAVIFFIGYFVGVMYPGLARKVGVA